MLATASRRSSGVHCCSLYTTKAVAADRLTLAEETPVTPSRAFVACEAQAAQWSPSRGNVFLIIPRPNLQYMRYRRTCPILWSAGALLPHVENTPARERFIPQASSSRSFPLLSDLRFRAPPPILPSFRTPPPPCSPLRLPPLYSFLRLSTPLSPLASIPNITLARVYIMVGHGG